MKRITITLLLFSLALGGCIHINYENRQVAPELIQVALVTPTRAPGEAAPGGLMDTPAALPVTEEPTASAPSTSPTPSQTPLPTGTPTSLPTATSTSAPLVVSMTGNTRCRSGPGVVYATLLYFNSGEQADLLGRSFSGDWLLVQKQGKAQVCWVALSVVEVTVSAVSQAAVVTAPPPPTSTAQPQATSTGGKSGPRATSAPTQPGATAAPTATIPPYP